MNGYGDESFMEVQEIDLQHKNSLKSHECMQDEDKNTWDCCENNLPFSNKEIEAKSPIENEKEKQPEDEDENRDLLHYYKGDKKVTESSEIGLQDEEIKKKASMSKKEENEEGNGIGEELKNNKPTEGNRKINRKRTKNMGFKFQDIMFLHELGRMSTPDILIQKVFGKP